MITALAWLPLQVSVTLCLILSVTLIVSAAVSEWRSWTLSAMTLLAVLMIWRGEGWKMLFLQSERRLSELQSRQRASILPHAESAYSSERFLSDGARCVQQRSSPPFLAGEPAESRQLRLTGSRSSREDREPWKANHNGLLTLQSLDAEGFPGASHPVPDSGQHERRLCSQTDLADSASKNHTDRHPNTFRLYMTYIV